MKKSLGIVTASALVGCLALAGSARAQFGGFMKKLEDVKKKVIVKPLESVRKAVMTPVAIPKPPAIEDKRVTFRNKLPADLQKEFDEIFPEIATLAKAMPQPAAAPETAPAPAAPAGDAPAAAPPADAPAEAPPADAPAPAEQPAGGN